MKHLLIILLFPVCVQAQSIKISPIPIPTGGLPSHSEIAIEYNDISVHFFHSLYNGTWYHEKWGDIGYAKSTIGLSYMPIKLFNIFSIGGIATNKKFPSSESTNLNFIIDAGLNIKNIRVSVYHISNGFSLLHEVNPGFHSVSIKYIFK